MDHRYIDEHSLADRYIDHTLPSKESGEFEAHLVDCQECRDRLLLAEMFHARNGVSRPSNPAPVAPGIRLSARLSVSRLVLIFAAATAAAILVLMASTALVFSILRSR